MCCAGSVVKRREFHGSSAEDRQRGRQDSGWQDDGCRCQSTELFLTATVRFIISTCDVETLVMMHVRNVYSLVATYMHILFLLYTACNYHFM